MCFRFDAWCCFGGVQDPDDEYYVSPAKGSVTPHHHAVPAKTTAPHHHPPPAQRNAHYHHGHDGLLAHHHHQLPVPAAADEKDREASNDARRGHAGAATKGGHGYAAGAAYVYPGPEGTVKQAARSTTVAADGERRDGARNFYPARREDTADQRYPTTTTSIANYSRY